MSESKVRPQIFNMIESFEGKQRTAFEGDIQGYLSTLFLAGETLNHQELVWLTARLSQDDNTRKDDKALAEVIRRYFVQLNRNH